MTLDAVEFLRRFLLHHLPRGLQRIRQYGLLANRRRTAQLARCRQLLGQSHVPVGSEPPDPADGLDATPSREVCPACGSGRLTIVAIILPATPALTPGARPPP